MNPSTCVYIDEKRKGRRPILIAGATNPLTTSEARTIAALLIRAAEYAEAGPEHRKANPGDFAVGLVARVCK